MAKVVAGYSPDKAVPPGDTLLETIEVLGLSQVELARRMGRPVKTINEIIKAKAAITPETAIQLERVVGTPASFWNNLQRNYELTRARLREEEELAKQSEALGKFPYAEAVKLGWLPKATSDTEKVRALLGFMGIGSLDTLPEVAGPAYRVGRSGKVSPQALAMWLRKGELQARSVETDPFDRGALISNLQALRKLTMKSAADFLPRLLGTCVSCGIALVFVPHIRGSNAHGASRWLTPDRVLIQLSIRGRREDIFWFTFFHEIGHILRHGKRSVFINLERDVGARSPEELEADQFAADLLLETNAYRAFAAPRRFSAARVCAFADSQNVCPGIVVGRLQHDKLLPPTHLNRLRRRFIWPHEKEE